ncbi:hypothetical protein [Psychromonas ossibalaenae]|uniref:hypothetical protein n=1 Tax=Psychromonas ossibalaenae TaxID=444922 RepID=UPI0003695088|nr:hypothetical protein [Psychromonas ossibalaenae]
MEIKPDNAKDDTKVDSSAKAPEVVFETIYVDSAPKLRNPEHLVHYELGKSGKKHGIHITSNDNNGLFSNEWVMLDDIAKCLEPLAKLDNFPSKLLVTLFKKKSCNNSGFLAAILRHEGVFGAVDKKMYQHHLIITSANLIKHFTSKPTQATTPDTPK